MAGEIFVGGVAVGVVPDLRGFNERLRRELVPAANRIGREIGREIVRGILDELDFGNIIAKSTAKSYAATRRAGFELGTAYGKAFRRGVELELEGISAKVRVELDRTSLAVAKAELAALGGTVGGGGGGGGRRGGKEDPLAGLLGGKQGPLDRLLLGGGSRSNLGTALGGSPLRGGVQAFAGLPLPGQVAAVGSALATLPFIAQVAAGGIVSAFGGGIAALGILGATGLKGSTPSAQVTAAHDRLASAQGREAAAQLRLNDLRKSGKASAAQLQSAEASLESAHASVEAAQEKYDKAQRSRLTNRQETVQAAFQELAANAKQDLATIGVSFVPVMMSIAETAQTYLGKMTPIFAQATKIISGPFKLIADTIITSFSSPAVITSIQAIANAFGDILTALAPDIPGIINSFAEAITRIAQAISDNPKAFANFINFLFQIVIAALDAIAFLTKLANYMEGRFKDNITGMVNAWNTVWRAIAGAVSVAVDAIRNALGAMVVSSGIALGAIRVVVEAIISVWHRIVDVARSVANSVVGAWNRVTGVFQSIMGWVASQFDPWWAANGDAIKAIWADIWGAATRVVRDFWNAILQIFNTSNAILNTVLGVFWDNVNSSSRAGMSVFTSIFRVGAGIILAIWRPFWNTISTIARDTWAIVVAVSRVGWAALEGLFRVGVGIIVEVWRLGWSVIVAIARTTWAAMKLLIKIGFDVVVGVFTVGINLLTGRWGAAWNAMKNTAHQVLNALTDFFRSTLSAWAVVWRTLLSNVVNIAKTAWGAIADTFKAMWNNVLRPAIQFMWNTFSSVFGAIVNGAATAFGWIPGIGGKLRDAAGQFNAFRDNVNNSLSGIRDKVVNVRVMTSSNNPYPGGITGRAQHGMMIPGYGGGDQHIIAVEGGELVLPKEAASDPLSHMIASQYGVPGFAAGGLLSNFNFSAMGNIGKTISGRISGSISGSLDQASALLRNIIHIILQALPNLLYQAGAAISQLSGFSSGGLVMDNGGWIPPGGAAYNLSGSPEPVLSSGQWSMLQAAARGDGGSTYVAHFDGLTGQAIEGHVRTAFQAMSLTEGNLSRPGRRS